MANKRLNATITIGGAVSGSLRTALGSTKNGLNQIGGAIADVTARQRQLNRIIADESKLGRSASALKIEYANKELAQLDRKLGKLRSINEQLKRNNNAQQANLARRAELRGGMVDAVAIGATVASPIVMAAKFENAMLGVAKQVDGARDKSGKLTKVYFDMAKQVQQLGREVPIATNEIADMVAAGARMGVAKNELIGFTRTAAMMSEAFELPAGELADQMGKIAGLYKIPVPAIGELADTINYLDDNAIAKGGDIIDYLTRVGGVASAVKIGGKEVAALGSTLLTLGERTETASTASNAFIQKLAAADKGTKKFKAAMQQIGMSTKEVQDGMQIDASGTMLKVLDKIGKLPKDQQLGVMVELIGLEHSDTLAKLANNTAEFRKQLALANGEAAKGSMAREFQARLQTTDAQFKLMKNNVSELAVNIGSVLLPAVNGLFGVLTPVVQAVANFAQEHPKLTQAIVGTVVALGTAKVAGMALSYAFTFVKGAALSAVGMFYRTAAAAATVGTTTTASAAGPTLLGRAFMFAGRALLWVGRALLLNPIGLAVTAIAGAAYLIYKNWEPVKAFFSNLWANITATFQTSLAWIMSKIDLVGQKWQDTKAFFGFGDAAAPKVGATMAAPGSAAAAAAGPAALPKLPAPGMKGGAKVYHDNSQTTIKVVQQPGQSTRELAEEITKIQDRKKGAQQRGRLSDGIGAQ